MQFRVFPLYLAVLLSVSACSTNKETATREVDFPRPENTIRIMFYNVENLFDVENDPTINDDEFTPEGTNYWTPYRYWEKQKHIAKVITNLGGWELPAIIGVCEIENRTVLEDLTRRTALSKFNYGIVHEESPDYRGIDVALLYRADIFRPISHEAINVTFPFDTNITTRDVLYVKGVMAGDTFHLFVNHWPSRRGGEQESAPKRIYVAGLVRARIDEILASDMEAPIIVMGDFNDGPDNTSIRETMRTSRTSDLLPAGELYNPMYDMKFKHGLGSHKYGNEWNTLDQFLVSAALVDSTMAVYTTEMDFKIFKADWLMEDDPYNPGKKPLRTYAGPRYLGGYSDHLPIFMDIHVRPERAENE